MKTLKLPAPTSLALGACALFTALASCSPVQADAHEWLEERCEPHLAFAYQLEGHAGSARVSVGAQRYTRDGSTSYNLLFYTHETFANQHNRFEVTEDFCVGLLEFYESFADSEVDGAGLVSYAYSGWSSESVEFHRYMREGHWKLIAGNLTMHRIDMPKLVDTIERALADLDKLKELPLTR